MAPTGKSAQQRKKGKKKKTNLLYKKNKNEIDKNRDTH